MALDVARLEDVVAAVGVVVEVADTADTTLPEASRTFIYKT